MTLMKTLEILIPTYGRPQSAAEAMESSLHSTDDRFGVRCNSNGFEQLLEKYRAFDPRLVYDSFDQNKGPRANAALLLNSTNAKFCMFLSDEDRIASDGISVFLDFLEGLDPNVSVISCSVYDLGEKKFSFLPHNKFKNISCDINKVAALSLIPTYMSGIVFRTEKLGELNLGNFTRDTPGNAYWHLNIALYLLRDAKLRFYHPIFVLKGKEVKYGGDGYSHRIQSRRKVKNNLDLNLNVYGPYARIRQFFYQMENLSGVKHSIKTVPYIMATSRSILFFRYAIRNLDNVVVIPEGLSLASEISRALDDSARQNPVKFPITALIFKVLVVAPLPLSNLLGSALDILIRIVGRVYFMRSVPLKT